MFGYIIDFILIRYKTRVTFNKKTIKEDNKKKLNFKNNSNG